MKKLSLFLTLLFSIFVSSSCSCFNMFNEEEEEIQFTITASSDTYYLGDPVIYLSIF